jgi:hypothetical protein
MSAARTCFHDHLDGTRCGAMALKRKSYCHFHQELEDRKRRRLAMIERLGGTDHTHIDLPAIEDRASAMIAINEVLQALAFGLIDRSAARTYFMGIRIGLSTIKSTALLPDFMEPDPENAPSMCEAFLAKLAELPMPENPDDPTPIPQIHACVDPSPFVGGRQQNAFNQPSALLGCHPERKRRIPFATPVFSIANVSPSISDG